jgi:hypothetical protein
MNPDAESRVLGLLEEAGLGEDDLLGELLGELAAFGDGPVPSPSPEVAALMAPRGRHRSRRPGHRRGTVIALLVVGSIGVGATAAAASDDVRRGAAQVASVALQAVPLDPVTVVIGTAGHRADPGGGSVAEHRAPITAAPAPASSSPSAITGTGGEGAGRAQRGDDANHQRGSQDGRGSDSKGRGKGSGSGDHVTGQKPGSGKGHGGSPEPVRQDAG